MSGALSRNSDRVGVREVLRLAWPVMVSMLSYTAMSLVDVLFVGRLGTAPLAGIGLSMSAAWLLLAFPNGLLAGAKVAIAQRTGAGDDARALRLALQGAFLAVAMGIAVAAAASSGRALFSAMGASPDTAAEAEAYFSVHLLGAPMIFLTAAFSAWFHGRGDTRTPMVATVLGNVVNVVLDPIFIFGLGPSPALGMGGAALATVIGIAAGTAFLGWRLAPPLSGVPAALDRALLSEIWSLGAPNGLRFLLDVASFTALGSILARAGDADLAPTSSWCASSA